MLESKVVSTPANVIPFEPKKKDMLDLKEILKDKEVADMYRLIAKHNLREQAIYLLNIQLHKLSN